MVQTRHRRLLTSIGGIGVAVAVAAAAGLLVFFLVRSSSPPTFHATGTFRFLEVTAHIVSDESLQVLGYEWKSLPKEGNAIWGVIAAHNAMTVIPCALGGEGPEGSLTYPHEGSFADACKKARQSGVWESENGELDHWLTSNTEPLALFQKAVRKPGFQFSVNAPRAGGPWPGFYGGLEFPIGGYLLLGDVALLEAARSLTGGEVDQAIDLAESCLLLAAHLSGNGEEPDRAYETCAGLILWGRGLGFLRSVLQSRSFEVKHLNELQRRLVDLLPRLPSYAPLLAAERRETRHALLDAELGCGQARPGLVSWRGVSGPFRTSGARGRIDRFFDLAGELPAMSPAEAFSEGTRTHLNNAAVEADPNGDFRLNRNIVSYYRNVLGTRTALDELRVAIGCLTFRKRERRFPTDLRELELETQSSPPRDRFSGQDLIYRPTDGGFTIQSPWERALWTGTRRWTTYQPTHREE
ncbi:MAG: hypothetical protein HN742_34380 [Lentisphaerae bacterium]|jgi:hypothetical protein|nr:hypothetical protein [Lentisphaerota bacterium]MBT4822193.1 hypothetical protein [Lentisphaerota bacterium]MBT5605046.1 hypothetical protein [Lentisphaerota bacterium]MBT7058668.1 hypothetical protein [Lentisphaerota bacterium]MBT7847009.1 hypothetical protein [Lentisphaerota bacterium]